MSLSLYNFATNQEVLQAYFDITHNIISIDQPLTGTILNNNIESFLSKTPDLKYLKLSREHFFKSLNAKKVVLKT